MPRPGPRFAGADQSSWQSEGCQMRKREPVPPLGHRGDDPALPPHRAATIMKRPSTRRRTISHRPQNPADLALPVTFHDREGSCTHFGDKTLRDHGKPGGDADFRDLQRAEKPPAVNRVVPVVAPRTMGHYFTASVIVDRNPRDVRGRYPQRWAAGSGVPLVAPRVTCALGREWARRCDLVSGWSYANAVASGAVLCGIGPVAGERPGRGHGPEGHGPERRRGAQIDCAAGLLDPPRSLA